MAYVVTKTTWIQPWRSNWTCTGENNFPADHISITKQKTVKDDENVKDGNDISIDFRMCDDAKNVQFGGSAHRLTGKEHSTARAISKGL